MTVPASSTYFLVKLSWLGSQTSGARRCRPCPDPSPERSWRCCRAHIRPCRRSATSTTSPKHVCNGLCTGPGRNADLDLFGGQRRHRKNADRGRKAECFQFGFHGISSVGARRIFGVVFSSWLRCVATSVPPCLRAGAADGPHDRISKRAAGSWIQV